MVSLDQALNFVRHGVEMIPNQAHLVTRIQLHSPLVISCSECLQRIHQVSNVMHHSQIGSQCHIAQRQQQQQYKPDNNGRLLQCPPVPVTQHVVNDGVKRLKQFTVDDINGLRHSGEIGLGRQAEHTVQHLLCGHGRKVRRGRVNHDRGAHQSSVIG